MAARSCPGVPSIWCYKNRIYRGEITHKGDAYPGEHPAIVNKPLWDNVQVILAENRVKRATGSEARHPSLLVKGLRVEFATRQNREIFAENRECFLSNRDPSPPMNVRNC
jgi:hypothetical protein